MPTIAVDGATIRYEDSGTADRPAVAFLPDVGFGPWVWGWQAPELSGRYRTIVVATRGTDGSEGSGPYTVDRFAADLEAVLADVGVRRVHLVGAGLGGAVALRYAREYGRARSLSLLGTAASGDRIDREALSSLHPSDPGRLGGSLSGAFTDQFIRESGLTERITGWRREEDATGAALAGHREAAIGFDPGPLYEVSLPALVCHGVADPVVDLEAGETLASELPGGRFEPIEGKRCCYLEHAAAVTDTISGFVSDAAAADE